MSEWRADFELLQAFSRQGDQPAFATLTRRHLDLVYATALRKVTDGGGAEEICQNVFGALARKAWQFAPDDSLPSWLHRTTLLESKSWLRGELRRRRREETAAELGTTMNTSENQPAFAALVPLLDEALLSLREKDRAALLLRFYESQSLREVGTAVGVSEDAARMRVQSALEKLAEFFKRRGFKTASVAAAAAALQHTAVSTSAAVASTVVSAALQVAPPALAGLAALLARLASLSRTQTAAVCVALAAVPVGWQLNEGRVTDRELNRVETQLIAGQRDADNLQAEIERLSATAGRLEQSVAQANETAARAAANAQAFADWKQRMRAPLLAAEYRWDDNSPFVRIPKAVLPELVRESAAEPFSPPGIVNPFARELLAMTPLEQQAMEEALRRHFADVEERVTAGIQETNLLMGGGARGGSVVARRSFALSPLPEDAMKPRHDQMLAEVRDVVGNERWPVVEAKPPEAGPRVPLAATGANVLMRSGESIEVWLEADSKGTLTVGGTFNGGSPTTNKYSLNIVGYVNAPNLSIFLPEGHPGRPADAEQTVKSFNPLVTGLLRQRVCAWLQEEAVARLNQKEHP
jgi:RNA polymerase sigma factor (sigma-70 family)